MVQESTQPHTHNPPVYLSNQQTEPYLQSARRSPRLPPLRPPSNPTGYQTDPPASLHRTERETMMNEKMERRKPLSN